MPRPRAIWIFFTSVVDSFRPLVMGARPAAVRTCTGGKLITGEAERELLYHPKALAPNALRSPTLSSAPRLPILRPRTAPCRCGCGTINSNGRRSRSSCAVQGTGHGRRVHSPAARPDDRVPGHGMVPALEARHGGRQDAWALKSTSTTRTAIRPDSAGGHVPARGARYGVAIRDTRVRGRPPRVAARGRTSRRWRWSATPTVRVTSHRAAFTMHLKLPARSRRDLPSEARQRESLDRRVSLCGSHQSADRAQVHRDHVRAVQARVRRGVRQDRQMVLR